MKAQMLHNLSRNIKRLLNQNCTDSRTTFFNFMKFWKCHFGATVILVLFCFFFYMHKHIFTLSQ
jgi:hypothetical protein